MQEILADLDRWQRDGEPLALATLVSVRRSAPRLPGARMLMTAAGLMSGSISAGCVEADILEHAMRVLRDSEPMLARYGISDEQGFDVGLSCGGEIEVLIEPFRESEAWTAVREQVRGQRPAVLALGLRPQRIAARPLAIVGESAVGSIDPALDGLIADEATSVLAEGAAKVVTLPFGDEQAEVFIQAFAPPQHLFIVGATHVATTLSRLASEVGYAVTVVDARSALATPERFPDADDVIAGWPDDALKERTLDSQTSVVVLTHDPKFDLPVLEIALRSDARYIGAMGSRKTHARRVEHLRKQGFSEADIARIHAPVGLDLGGQTPEELALAILGEIVAARYGRRLDVTEDK